MSDALLDRVEMQANRLGFMLAADEDEVGIYLMRRDKIIASFDTPVQAICWMDGYEAGTKAKKP